MGLKKIDRPAKVNRFDLTMSFDRKKGVLSIASNFQAHQNAPEVPLMVNGVTHKIEFINGLGQVQFEKSDPEVLYKSWVTGAGPQRQQKLAFYY